MPEPVAPPSVAIDSKVIESFRAILPRVKEQVEEMTVQGDEDFLAAGSMLDQITKRKDDVTRYFAAPAKNAFELHRWITSTRAALIAPLEQLDRLLRGRREEYRAQKERARREQEAAAAAAAQHEREEQAVQDAARLHASGEPEAAERVIEQAVTAPPPPVMVASTLPKEKGVSIRTTYEYRVTDQSKITAGFMMPNDKAIQALVDKLGKDAATIVGGIEVVPNQQEVRRRTA